MTARSAQLLALRDTLAAVLRDSEVPLTAREAGDLVPYTTHMKDRVPGGISCDDPRSRSHEDAWHQCSGGVCFFTMGHGIGSSAYQQLCVLERAGLVERFKMERRAYWRWIGESVELPPLVVAEQG